MMPRRGSVAASYGGVAATSLLIPADGHNHNHDSDQTVR
jgi:hypothetical protein